MKKSLMRFRPIEFIVIWYFKQVFKGEVEYYEKHKWEHEQLINGEFDFY